MDPTVSFNEIGYVRVAGLLTSGQCDRILASIDEAGIADTASRNLLDGDWCRELAAQLKCRQEISTLFPANGVVVQCTLFDKSTDKNWLVPLHQDLSVPVRERVSSEQCTGWSTKEGVVYVQPPKDVLESLVAVRVHLDDCLSDNGPLRVVPGSHRHGRLNGGEADDLRSRSGEVELNAHRGDVIAMRALLLHASSKAQRPSRRRVLHFLFGPQEIGYGLTWNCAI